MNSVPIMFSAPMVRAILEGRKTQTRRLIRPQPPCEREGDYAVGRYHPTKVGRDGEEYPGGEVFGMYSLDGEWGRKCPYPPGSLLWVREAWQAIHVAVDPETGRGEDVTWADRIPDAHIGWWSPVYAADPQHAPTEEERGFPWRPAIHMPRWASRIMLRVTDVRAQRLRDITPEDAIAEGATSRPHCCGYRQQEPGWSMDWSEVGRPSRWAPSGVLTESDIALETPILAFRHYWDRLHARSRFGWGANPWVWAISFERVRGDG